MSLRNVSHNNKRLNVFRKTKILQSFKNEYNHTKSHLKPALVPTAPGEICSHDVPFNKPTSWTKMKNLGDYNVDLAN